MIRLESFADTGPDSSKPAEPDSSKPAEPDSSKPAEPDPSKPISPSSVNTETAGGNAEQSAIKSPKSPLAAIAVTPPVDDPIPAESNPNSVPDMPSDKKSLLKLESYCEPPPLGNSRPTSATANHSDSESIKPPVCEEPVDKPAKSLDAAIRGSSNPKDRPTRRRTYDDGPAQFPTRRRSLRDKILSNIIDHTFGTAIVHITDGVPSETKYEPDEKVLPPAKPTTVRERRSSFGDAQPSKRRGSIRDKIIGHIIQAAVMGVGHTDESDKKSETQV